MNRENVLKLIARIENAPPEQFDMQTFFNGNTRKVSEAGAPPCGTAACIGGWAFFEAPVSQREIGIDGEAFFYSTARDWLGLTGDEASSLFVPWGCDTRTRDEALDVLRHLAETGEVKWS